MTSGSLCIRFFRHSRFFIFWHCFWLHIFTADTTCQMSSQTVWSCKLSFTLWTLMSTHWKRFGEWTTFTWFYPLYICSDIQTHSFVNIYHKNMTISTLSYYLHVILLLQHLSEDCIFLFCCSLLQKENSFFYHICAPLYFFPSYISFLMTFFLVGFLSAYEVLYDTFYSTLVAFLARLYFPTLYSAFSLDIEFAHIAHMIFSWSFGCRCYHIIIAACIFLSCWEIHSSSFSVRRTIRSVNQNHHIYTDSKIDQLFKRLKCNFTKVFPLTKGTDLPISSLISIWTWSI